MSAKGIAFFRRAELGCGVGQVEVEAGFVPDASLRRLTAELQALFPNLPKFAMLYSARGGSSPRDNKKTRTGDLHEDSAQRGVGGGDNSQFRKRIEPDASSRGRCGFQLWQA